MRYDLMQLEAVMRDVSHKRRNGRMVETSMAQCTVVLLVLLQVRDDSHAIPDSCLLLVVALVGFARRYSQRRAGCGLCRHLPSFFRCLEFDLQT